MHHDLRKTARSLGVGTTAWRLIYGGIVNTGAIIVWPAGWTWTQAAAAWCRPTLGSCTTGKL